MVSESLCDNIVCNVLLGVLILIVLEYGLGDLSYLNICVKRSLSLNPYCAGIWSRSRLDYIKYRLTSQVLILIVLEYGLGGL